MHQALRRTCRILASSFASMYLLSVAAPAHAQDPATHPEQSPLLSTSARQKHPTRIYLTMWTLHLKDDKPALDNNWVIGASAHGWFGATFLNSYRRRGYAAGLQRSIISTGEGAVRTTLGYRLGFISGYDGRLAAFARDSPILPLIQPFFVVDFWHVGYEVSYTFVVASAQISYRF